MNTEINWNDDVEAVDFDLIAALEEEILKGKSELCRLSSDDEQEELIF